VMQTHNSDHPDQVVDGVETVHNARRAWVEQSRPGLVRGRERRAFFMRHVTGMTKLRWFGVSAALVVALAAGPGAAAAGEQYPVPYTFTANVVAGATQPGTPPPGSNDWSCRPSKAHPRPVILVHGLFANMTDNWQTMS